MNIDAMIKILQAYKRGEVMQYRFIGDSAWVEVSDDKPLGSCEYRIKPREPMEGYICVDTGIKKFHSTRASASVFADSSPGRYKIIKVREVIE